MKTEVCHWRLLSGQIESEVVNLEGVEEIQGLYPGYEEELKFYNLNGKLPYDILKESVEGENIPIDTTTNKTVGLIFINLAVTSSSGINISNNVAIDSASNMNPVVNSAQNFGNQDPFGELVVNQNPNNDPIVNSGQNYGSQDPFGDFPSNQSKFYLLKTIRSLHKIITKTSQGLTTPTLRTIISESHQEKILKLRAVGTLITTCLLQTKTISTITTLMPLFHRR